MRWRDSGRGDLTDQQWQKLQPLCHPKSSQVNQLTLIVALSMVFCGYIELVPWRIFKSVMVSTAQSQVGFMLAI